MTERLTNPEAWAAQIRQRGFVAIPGLVDTDLVARCSEALDNVWRAHGEPTLFDPATEALDSHTTISPVGMVCADILRRAPWLAEVLIRADLLAAVESLLGPRPVLEYGAGIVSDSERGFFFWHHHVGGIDADDVRRDGYEPLTRCVRLGCTIYGSALDDEHGVMLVWPRRAADPAESADPPFEPGREPWPGATEVRVPPGSVVIFDQGTWHAVTPMTRAGRRHFFGFFMRSAALAPTARVDEALRATVLADAGLAAAYEVQR